ncbi:hypothetical protein Ddye_022975 [Dipteronia dyeriana]|uniref:Uncharacterized protein n=1 Tax=Dipteronia dyeriana TaxID=168575 RepID=A0AAD9TS35_9ROSI|nr:hypothetical protein Ddye_022975 [Dipteronia dyeriana]
MSRPKRKTSVDSQRELVHLAYKKKTSDDSPSSRKAANFPFVSSIVTPSVVLTPQMSTHLPLSSLGQLVPFRQCTPFGQSSQSPFLGGVSSIPYPREPRARDSNPSPYLKRYSKRVLNMAIPKKDGLLVRSVDEFVTSFNKKKLHHFADQYVSWQPRLAIADRGYYLLTTS